MVQYFNFNSTNIKTTGNYIEEKRQKTIYLTTTSKANDNIYDKNYGFNVPPAPGNKQIIRANSFKSLLDVAKGKCLVNDNISNYCLQIGYPIDLSGCN